MKKYQIIILLLISCAVLIGIACSSITITLDPTEPSSVEQNNIDIVQTNTFSPTDTMNPTKTSNPTVIMKIYIPDGEFLMGSNDEDVPPITMGFESLMAYGETPIHSVYLDGYWIDRTEVTNAMYAKCVNAGHCEIPKDENGIPVNDYYGNPIFDNYPVVYVNWQNATDYCGWIGGRLPTEAEWEKAARGTDGRKYPWGNQSPNNLYANYNKDEINAVGSYPDGQSPYGVQDMAGNVSEWVSDWWDENYYSNSPTNNPTGPDSGEKRVLRGGSINGSENSIRSTNRERFYPQATTFYYGFRCVTEN